MLKYTLGSVLLGIVIIGSVISLWLFPFIKSGKPFFEIIEPPKPTPIYKVVLSDPSITPIEKAKTNTFKPADKSVSGWTLEADGDMTKANIPDDPHMSSPEELFTAVNNYRLSHGLSSVQQDELLCIIAHNRSIETNNNFSHDGIEKYIKSQNRFSLVGEVLARSKLSGVHIVEYGWDRSLTGHREALQDPQWTHGCAAIQDFTAVFIFGRKR